MSIHWSNFEVVWESRSAIQNRFFDNEISMTEYANSLVSHEGIIHVETHVHEGPHGGTTRTVLLTCPEACMSQARRTRKTAERGSLAASASPLPEPRDLYDAIVGAARALRSADNHAGSLMAGHLLSLAEDVKRLDAKDALTYLDRAEAERKALDLSRPRHPFYG